MAASPVSSTACHGEWRHHGRAAGELRCFSWGAIARAAGKLRHGKRWTEYLSISGFGKLAASLVTAAMFIRSALRRLSFDIASSSPGGSFSPWRRSRLCLGLLM
ncbi:unnamed protein product [Urochloa humidicola]